MHGRADSPRGRCREGAVSGHDTLLPPPAGPGMTVARTWAVALNGAVGSIVEVEADLSNQTPDMRIIGLPDKALNEASRRVHNACENSGLPLPRRRLTVNLSPANLPKHGSAFDLAIAVAAIAIACFRVVLQSRENIIPDGVTKGGSPHGLAVLAIINRVITTRQ